MLTKSNIISSILLAIALTCSWLIYQWLSIPHLPPPQANQPDAFLVNAFAVEMTSAGKPKNQFISPLVVHYSIHNTVDITTPHFTFFPDTGTPWQMHAQQGQAREKANEPKVLELWGHVRVERTAGPNNQPIKMSTEALSIFPKEEVAETKLPITIEQPGGIVHAVGMRANLKTGDVELLSQAHGQYDKSKAPPQ